VRGFYLGVDALTLFDSNYIAPMIAGVGFEIHTNDISVCRKCTDKWVFWFCAIQQGVGFIISVFFMEESNYNSRTTERHDGDDETSRDRRDSSVPLNSRDKGQGSGFTHVTTTTNRYDLVGNPQTFLERMSVFKSLGSVRRKCSLAYIDHWCF
jgi:hypothetical protein